MIKDGKGTDYFTFKGMSREYIIDKDELILVAEKYNLYPQVISDHLSMVKPLANIYDDYPKHDRKTKLSQLYFSFTFIKILPSEDIEENTVFEPLLVE